MRFGECMGIRNLRVPVKRQPIQFKWPYNIWYIGCRPITVGLTRYITYPAVYSRKFNEKTDFWETL